MKRKYYIAYGSNLDVNQMLRRCPDAVTVGSSTIEGYQLVFRGNRRSGVANIEPCEGASVPVGIWAISPSDEKALDCYEGYPWLYTKQTFTLPVRGKMIKGMAYIMTPGHRVAAPVQQYLDIILEGYKDFGFAPALLLDAAAEATKGKNMEEYAQDALLETIKIGDIGAVQKALKLIEERGLEVIVKRKDATQDA